MVDCSNQYGFKEMLLRLLLTETDHGRWLSLQICDYIVFTHTHILSKRFTSKGTMISLAVYRPCISRRVRMEIKINYSWTLNTGESHHLVARCSFTDCFWKGPIRFTSFVPRSKTCPMIGGDEIEIICRTVKSSCCEFSAYTFSY